MRVAIFTDTFLPQINGVTNTLSKLINYFNVRGIEYLVFAPNDYSEIVNTKYNLEQFSSLKFFLYPECRISFPNTNRIKKSLIDFKPDVIHIFTEFNMGISGLLLSKKLNIPSISTYTTNFSEYLKYYNLEILENISWSYMKWFHNSNNITLCGSKVTESLLNNNGVNNTRIFSRGIDCEKFKWCKRSNKLRKALGVEDKIVLLYVGRIAPEKDLATLNKAYRRLLNNDKYKDKIQLIVTGDGPDLRKCKEVFPQNTIFTGFKKDNELAEIYASCDIFTFPSPTETFGNVILEAMASGLPVIAANDGGVKNTIENGKNGLLFNTGNDEDLYEKIIKVVNDDNIRNEIIQNGIKVAKEKEWDNVFNSLMGIYQEVGVNGSREKVS